MKSLGEAALAEYNRGRRKWHANLGPLVTPQMEELHEDLSDIFDSNDQDSDKVKGGIALDAFPGLGKTTAVLAFARKLHRRILQEEGKYTDEGHERWPVCRVGLTSNTGMRDFNRSILEYYGHPGRFRGTAADFGYRALDSVLSAELRADVVPHEAVLPVRLVGCPAEHGGLHLLLEDGPSLIVLGRQPSRNSSWYVLSSRSSTWTYQLPSIPSSTRSRTRCAFPRWRLASILPIAGFVGFFTTHPASSVAISMA
ncbi:hypothetical protein AB0J21_24385 [Streptomyces sp. NPDC049954]|uniref:hypothetical protein n=1 Tax=Streptomyces sp. NPDC049954 TaxID=3155779 RepID=UPI00342F41D5